MRTKIFCNNKPTSRKEMVERLGLGDYLQALIVAFNDRDTGIQGVFVGGDFLHFTFTGIDPKKPVYVDREKASLYQSKEKVSFYYQY